MIEIIVNNSQILRNKPVTALTGTFQKRFQVSKLLGFTATAGLVTLTRKWDLWLRTKITRYILLVL